RFTILADASNEGLPNFQDASIALDLRLAYPHLHAEGLPDTESEKNQQPVGVEPMLILAILTDSEDAFSFQMNRTQFASFYRLLSVWGARIDTAKTLADDLAGRVERQPK